jgi:hypothetical protein
MQTNTNNINKTCALKKTGGKDELNIVFYEEIVTDIRVTRRGSYMKTYLYI